MTKKRGSCQIILQKKMIQWVEHILKKVETLKIKKFENNIPNKR